MRVDGKAGFIDRSGIRLGSAEYDATDEPSEGLAKVFNLDPTKKDPLTRLVKRTVGFVDEEGKLAIPLTFDDARGFHGGLSAARQGKRWGYIDRAGRWAIEPAYDNAWSFSEERAVVDKGKATLCLAPDGSVAFTAPSRKLGEHHHGLAACEVNHQWSYLKLDGTVAFAVTASAASRFSDGRARILVKRRDGFVDVTGQLVIPTTFSSCGNFSEGLAAAADAANPGAGMGYIDTSGRWAVAPRWSFCDGFSEGLAAVTEKGAVRAFSYVDRVGTVVFGPVASDVAGPFHGGLARLQDGAKVGYVDTQGQPVWPIQG